MTPEPEYEATAVSLKAAYSVLREINKSPEPPSLESIARIIDESLRFSEAIALIDEAAIMLDGGPDHHLVTACRELLDWARR